MGSGIGIGCNFVLFFYPLGRWSSDDIIRSEIGFIPLPQILQVQPLQLSEQFSSPGNPEVPVHLFVDQDHLGVRAHYADIHANAHAKIYALCHVGDIEIHLGDGDATAVSFPRFGDRHEGPI